jgi:DNA gyrase subunit A
MADTNTQQIPIEEEMRQSFLSYAMSVIVARALPDARDGLKPVHRRILFAQHGVSNVWNRPYVKCARIVGDVLGKYHPHGDAATYDALVRMAQDFSMRYPLIDGQGNFGSIDGDPPAAYRYTECRMARLSSELLADIEKETVDHVPNYDDKEEEPTVLPSKVPNLLLNGATGIAVGMATNIPPHNLREIVNATIALINDPAMTADDLLKIVPGPDFPTGGTIIGRGGIARAYKEGNGKIIVRGKVDIEEMKGGRSAIIVTEVPYQVNKARWIEQTAEHVREKRLEGISDLRDESDREGIRVVIELKKDAVPAVVLNNLYKQTDLQTSFNVNMLAIVEGRPVTLTLKDALAKFIEHRRDVVTRRSMFDLRKARERREIVEGLGLAVANIDRVIAIIRASANPDQARTSLMAEPMKGLAEFLERAGRPASELATVKAAKEHFLTERQADAILAMRLSQLTGLEREKLEGEYKELWGTTDFLESILGDETKLFAEIIKELESIREQYGDDRRTLIQDTEADLTDEQLIAEEDMVVTVTHGGYVKRTPVTEYRAQQRGGKGVKGAESDDGDFVAELFVAGTHDTILMFTTAGRVYSKRVFELPAGKREGRGKALVNVLELQNEEKVVTTLPIKTFDPQSFVFMATRSGTVKKTELDSFANIRATGIKAIGLDEGDQLIAVKLTNGDSDVMLGTKNGYAVRFRDDQVRPMGRDARGVRGIAVREGDAVVGMATFRRDDTTLSLLTICERGYGKRTSLDEYPTKNRGGMGVIAIRASERNGKVVALRVVSNEDHLIVITDKGKLIRVPVGGVSQVGRNTQGVRIMRVDGVEKVTSVERLAEPEDTAGIEEAPPIAAEAVEAEELPEGGEAEGEGDEPPADDDGDAE